MSTYIAIDGGTTNTRVNYVKNGGILETVRLPYGSNPRDCKNLRGSARDAIESLCKKHGSPDCVLGCGMLTSELGLFEVKHLPAPAGIAELHNGIRCVKIPDVTDLPVYLIPGIKKYDSSFLQTDMMRGEETELIGLVDRLERDCVYILPGSHSKILCVDEKGRIDTIRTFLTGEMQVALANHTVLASSIDIHQTPVPEFLSMGYRYALEHGLNETLLKVRVMDTQFHIPADQVYSFFLGAVLEGEVTEIIKVPQRRVVIGGQKQLKEATCILLSGLCDKEILPLPDTASGEASVIGMIRIFEYRK